MRLHYTPEIANPLNWHKERKLFTIEASDLQDSDVTPLGQYAHRSITIYVPASGNRKEFYEYSVKRDNENDVMWWTYWSSDGFELRVYND